MQKGKDFCDRKIREKKGMKCNIRVCNMLLLFFPLDHVLFQMKTIIHHTSYLCFERLNHFHHCMQMSLYFESTNHK